MRLNGFASLRFLLSASALAAAAADAQTVDLVGHKGFEACWSKALTKTEFLAAMGEAVGASGTTFCAASTSGSGTGFTYTACGHADCPGGAIGCPVTIHSNGFGGDFATGAFTASGTADDIAVPVDYSSIGGSGSCTITISNIALTYSPSYFITDDGNFGDYMAYLTQSQVTVDNYVANSPDLFCQTSINFLGTSLVTDTETAAGTELATLLDAGTTGDSVCPLTP